MAKRYHDGERRHKHMSENGMLHEDHSAIANMPQEVMMKQYASNDGDYMNHDLDDTIRGVDSQLGMDASKRKSGMRPKKV